MEPAGAPTWAQCKETWRVEPTAAGPLCPLAFLPPLLCRSLVWYSRKKSLRSHHSYQSLDQGLYDCSVSVHSGCSDKTITEEGAYKEQRFISHSSGGWKSKRSTDWVSSPGRGEEGALWGVFDQGTDIIHGGSTLMP